MRPPSGSRSAPARTCPERQVAELTVRAAQDFDAFYTDRLREPEAGNALVVLRFDDKGNNDLESKPFVIADLE